MQVAMQMRDEVQLPWEASRELSSRWKQLGPLKPAILAMVRHDPAHRMTMSAFCDACTAVCVTPSAGFMSQQAQSQSLSQT
jgi:hypothetical protein